jgi:ATP-dependent DNA helicase RecG
VEDDKKLMDEIPNKIKYNMGLLSKSFFCRMATNTLSKLSYKPYSVRYYYRSGSVTQEMTGAAFDEFLLKRNAQTWDVVI